MTEDEHILLTELGNEFWHGFSKLIAENLQKVPKHLRPEFLVMMQDKASVYGSCYEKYLPPRGPIKCRCRDDEFCGAEFESHHKPGEITCCPECGRQQMPLEIE